MPFTVGVRDRCMYSHSLRFGNEEPFRTGCTAVVDVKLTGPELNSDGVLCDILAAQRALRSVLEGFEHVDRLRGQEHDRGSSRAGHLCRIYHAIEDRGRAGPDHCHFSVRGRVGHRLGGVFVGGAPGRVAAGPRRALVLSCASLARLGHNTVLRLIRTCRW